MGFRASSSYLNRGGGMIPGEEEKDGSKQAVPKIESCVLDPNALDANSSEHTKGMSPTQHKSQSASSASNKDRKESGRKGQKTHRRKATGDRSVTSSSDADTEDTALETITLDGICVVQPSDPIANEPVAALQGDTITSSMAEAFPPFLSVELKSSSFRNADKKKRKKVRFNFSKNSHFVSPVRSNPSRKEKQALWWTARDLSEFRTSAEECKSAVHAQLQSNLNLIYSDVATGAISSTAAATASNEVPPGAKHTADPARHCLLVSYAQTRGLEDVIVSKITQNRRQVKEDFFKAQKKLSKKKKSSDGLSKSKARQQKTEALAKAASELSKKSIQWALFLGSVDAVPWPKKKKNTSSRTLATAETDVETERDTVIDASEGSGHGAQAVPGEAETVLKHQRGGRVFLAISTPQEPNYS